MKPNYPYPKSEDEFFSRSYSVDQLIENYTFPMLMHYYVFGLNVLQRIESVIEGELYDELGVEPDEVEQDKMHFTLRTVIVRNAMTKMNACELLMCQNAVMVQVLN